MMPRLAHALAPIAEHVARTFGRAMEVIDCGYSVWSERMAAPTHLPVMTRVTTGRTWQPFRMKKRTGLTSTDRAKLAGRFSTPCQGEGRGFESRRPLPEHAPGDRREGRVQVHKPRPSWENSSPPTETSPGRRGASQPERE